MAADSIKFHDNRLDLVLGPFCEEWEQIKKSNLKNFKKEELEVFYREAFDLANRIIALTEDPILAVTKRVTSLIHKVVHFYEQIWERMYPSPVKKRKYAKRA
jgi:hypothetical protein